MDKQIKPCRHVPSKNPHPKFQCWTELYIYSFPPRSRFDILCPPHPSAQPKDNIEIWGCGGDDTTARVVFHSPSTVVLEKKNSGVLHSHIGIAPTFFFKTWAVLFVYHKYVYIYIYEICKFQIIMYIYILFIYINSKCIYISHIVSYRSTMRSSTCQLTFWGSGNRRLYCNQALDYEFLR